MLLKNYHTHTYRCRHASGDVAEYCRAARSSGMTVLGFTDHTPLPDGRWPSVRMAATELADYCAALDRAATDFPQLLVLKGMECEYAPELVSFYREELLGRYGLQYLIAGGHWYPHEGEWVGIYGTAMDAGMLRSYTEYLVESMQSGIYAFIAHPDLFGVCYARWDRHAEAAADAICQAAAALSLPLEINAYGFRKPYVDNGEGTRPKYPWAPFWEVAAAWDVPVIVSSDAHRPEDVLADTEQGCALADRFGLRQVELHEIEQAAQTA